MKSLRILIAILALTPSLAFAGNRHWRGGCREARYETSYRHDGWGRGYVVERVVYEAPRPVVYVRPQPNPVALGLAAGIVTGLVVASLVHGR